MLHWEEWSPQRGWLMVWVNDSLSQSDVCSGCQSANLPSSSQWLIKHHSILSIKKVLIQSFILHGKIVLDGGQGEWRGINHSLGPGEQKWHSEENGRNLLCQEVLALFVNQTVSDPRKWQCQAGRPWWEPWVCEYWVLCRDESDQSWHVCYEMSLEEFQSGKGM